MKFISYLAVTLLVACTVSAQEKCNPVEIVVSANQSRLIDESESAADARLSEISDSTSAVTTVAIQKDAIKFFRQALEKSKENSQRMGAAILKNRCKDQPMVFGAPRPVTK